MESVELDQDLQYVYNVFKKESKKEYSDIFNELDIENSELYRCLHRLIQLGLVYKVKNTYHATELTGNTKQRKVSSAINNTAQLLKNHKDKQAQMVIKADAVFKPKVDTRVFGKLQRKGDKASIALFLYKKRNSGDGFTSQDISSILKLKAEYGILINLLSLIDDGYIEADNSFSENVKYKWSNKFIYPFSKLQSTDDDLLEYKV